MDKFSRSRLSALVVSGIHSSGRTVHEFERTSVVPAPNLPGVRCGL